MNHVTERFYPLRTINKFARFKASDMYNKISKQLNLERPEFRVKKNSIDAIKHGRESIVIEQLCDRIKVTSPLNVIVLLEFKSKSYSRNYIDSRNYFVCTDGNMIFAAGLEEIEFLEGESDVQK